MSQYNEWKNGVFLTFDLPINDLKTYYSNTSPQNAYTVIRKYLVANGFEALGDSDYRNFNINKLQTLKLFDEFSKKHKWFVFCLDKLDIAPNTKRLDVAPQFRLTGDKEFKKQKEEEYKKILEREKANNKKSVSNNKPVNKKDNLLDDYFEKMPYSEQLELLIRLQDKFFKDNNLDSKEFDDIRERFENLEQNKEIIKRNENLKTNEENLEDEIDDELEI